MNDIQPPVNIQAELNLQGFSNPTHSYYQKFTQMQNFHYQSLLSMADEESGATTQDFLNSVLKNSKQSIEFMENVVRDFDSKLAEAQKGSSSSGVITIDPSHYTYDEQFVSIINNLSNKIKATNKSHKNALELIKYNTDNIKDSTTIIKNMLAEISLYINTPIAGKYSQKPITDKEKSLREKSNQFIERADSLLEVVTNLNKYAAQIEKSNSTFYNDARDIFREMKKMRLTKSDDIKSKLERLGSDIQFALSPIVNQNLGVDCSEYINKAVQAKPISTTLTNFKSSPEENLKQEIKVLRQENSKLREEIKDKTKELRAYSLEKIRSSASSRGKNQINQASSIYSSTFTNRVIGNQNQSRQKIEVKTNSSGVSSYADSSNINNNNITSIKSGGVIGKSRVQENLEEAVNTASYKSNLTSYPINISSTGKVSKYDTLYSSTNSPNVEINTNFTKPNSRAESLKQENRLGHPNKQSNININSSQISLNIHPKQSNDSKIKLIGITATPSKIAQPITIVPQPKVNNGINSKSLSTLIIDFMTSLSNVQAAIKEGQFNIPEKKKEFEKKKRNLLTIAQGVLSGDSYLDTSKAKDNLTDDNFNNTTSDFLSNSQPSKEKVSTSPVYKKAQFNSKLDFHSKGDVSPSTKSQIAYSYTVSSFNLTLNKTCKEFKLGTKIWFSIEATKPSVLQSLPVEINKILIELNLKAKPMTTLKDDASNEIALYLKSLLTGIQKNNEVVFLEKNEQLEASLLKNSLLSSQLKETNIKFQNELESANLARQRGLSQQSNLESKIGELSGVIEDLINKLETSESERAAFQKESEEAKSKEEAVRSDIKIISKEFFDFKSKSREITDSLRFNLEEALKLNQQFEITKSKQEQEILNQKKQLDELSAKNENISHLSSSAESTLKDQIKACTEEAGKWKTSFEEKSKELQSFQAEMKNLYSNLKLEHDQCINEKSALKAEIFSNEIQIKELRDNTAVMTLEQQNLKLKLNSEIDEYKNEVLALKRNETNNLNEIEGLKNLMIKAENEKSDAILQFMNCSSKLKEVEVEVTLLKTTAINFEKCTSHNQKLEAECKDLVNRIQGLQSDKDKEVINYENTIKKLLDETSLKKEELEKLQSQLDHLESENSELLMNARDLEEKLLTRDKQISLNSAELKDAFALLNDANKLVETERKSAADTLKSSLSKLTEDFKALIQSKEAIILDLNAALKELLDKNTQLITRNAELEDQIQRKTEDFNNLIKDVKNDNIKNFELEKQRICQENDSRIQKLKLEYSEEKSILIEKHNKALRSATSKNEELQEILKLCKEEDKLIRAELNQNHSQLVRAQGELAQLKSILEERVGQVVSLTSKLEEQINFNHELTAEVNQLKIKLQNAQETLSKSELSLEDKKKELANEKAESDNLKNDLKAKEEKLSQTEKQLIAERSNCSQEIKSAEIELQKAKTNIEELGNLLSKNKSVLEDLKSENVDLGKRLELQDSQIKQLNKTNEDLKKKLEEASKFQEEESKSQLKKSSILNEERESLNMQISQLQANLINAELSFKNLREAQNNNIIELERQLGGNQLDYSQLKEDLLKSLDLLETTKTQLEAQQTQNKAKDQMIEILTAKNIELKNDYSAFSHEFKVTLQEEKDNLCKDYDDRIKELIEKSQVANSELDNLKAKKLENDEIISNLNKKILDLQDNVSLKESELAKLNNSKRMDKESMKNLNNINLKYSSDIKGKEDEIESLNKKLTEITEFWEASNQKLAEAEKLRLNLQDENKTIKADLDTLSKDNVDFKLKVHSLENLVSFYENEIRNKEAQIQILMKEELKPRAEAPQSGQNVAEPQFINNEEELGMKEMEQIEEIPAPSKDISSVEEILENSSLIHPDKEIDIEHSNLDVETIAKEKADKIDMVNILQEKIDELSRRNEGLSNVHESLIQKLSAKDDELDKVRHQLEKAQKKIGTLEFTSSENQQGIPMDTYKKMIDNLVKEEAKYNSLTKKHDKLKKEYDAIMLAFNNSKFLNSIN